MNKPRRFCRTILLGLGVIVGAGVLAVLAAALYLTFTDCSEHRERVERLLSDVLGRDLEIRGVFEASIRPRTRTTSWNRASDPG